MSNYVKATNFAAKDALPTGNSGKIIKGTEIDTEYNAIASAISSKADTNSPSFTGSPLAPTASAGTNNTQIATTAFVAAAITAATTALIPAGMIMIWSGSVGSVPTGWALCDGSGGRPDLRDKFVLGAGSSYAVNATGGDKDAIVVSHTHTYSGTTASNGAHQHYTFNADAVYGGPNAPGPSTYPTFFCRDGSNSQNYTINGSSTIASIGLTSSAGAHTHTVSGTTDSSGSSGLNANMPPYYALCYIIKT